MRILFLSQFFQPEPFFKALPFAKALKELGHEVEVLTGFPNYPGGKIYDGYRVRVFQREFIDGIRVNRVPLYPSHDKSARRRSLNYGSFALSASLQGALRVKRPDVIYVYHPPGTVGLPAAVLRSIFRCAVVYDIQDMWPDTILSTGMMGRGRLFRTIDRYMRWVYRHADRIVAQSPGFQRILAERGVSPDKISLIYNWCEESSAKVDEIADPDVKQEGRFALLFAGTMGVAQNLDCVLDAAEILQREDCPVDFVLIGGGICRGALEERSAQMGLSNVRFLAPRKQTEMGPVFQAADALLVHLSDDPLYRFTIPSKTQAYLASGKPILMAMGGDATDLVLQAGAGLACPPGDPQALADTAKVMATMSPQHLAEMGRRGREFYLNELQMKVGVERMLDAFEQAVKSRKGR